MLEDTAYYFGHIVLLFIISVALGKIIGPIIVRILEMLVGKTETTLDDRILASVKTPLATFSFIIIFYFLLHAFPALVDAAAFLEKYTYAILVIIATFMISEASGAFIRWYHEEGYKEKHGKMGVDLSLLPLVRKVTKIAIYVVGLTVALSATGFDVTGLLAVTSVLGLILGLASQETLGNIFAGIALQVDRPFHYGDYLKLPSGEIAIIRKVGMRSTKLEDISHHTIFISNSEFAKMRITNFSLPDKLGMIGVSAELPSTVDLKKLEAKIISEISKKAPTGLDAKKGFSLSIDAVRPSSVAFTFYFWANGYENVQAIKDTVNRTMLEFARAKK